MQTQLFTQCMLLDPNLPFQVLMKLFLVRLVQTYEVTLPDEYKLEVEHKLLKRTADDIMCTIQQRK